MADSTDSLGQMVKKMKTLVVAGEGGHILGPRRQNEQRTMGTGFETAALGFPITADGLYLYVNHS